MFNSKSVITLHLLIFVWVSIWYIKLRLIDVVILVILFSILPTRYLIIYLKTCGRTVLIVCTHSGVKKWPWQKKYFPRARKFLSRQILPLFCNYFPLWHFTPRKYYCGFFPLRKRIYNFYFCSDLYYNMYSISAFNHRGL